MHCISESCATDCNQRVLYLWRCKQPQLTPALYGLPVRRQAVYTTEASFMLQIAQALSPWFRVLCGLQGHVSSSQPSVPPSMRKGWRWESCP